MARSVSPALVGGATRDQRLDASAFSVLPLSISAPQAATVCRRHARARRPNRARIDAQILGRSTPVADPLRKRDP